MALIGHWRDNVGGQIPVGGTFGAFNVAQQIRNDSGGNYSKPNDSTIQLADAAGASDGYLFIANIQYNDPSNGRANYQGRFELTSGTGQLFTTHMTGYNRNTSNSDAWVRVIGFLRNNSANAQIQLQHRRDSDVPTGGSVINASDLQVVKFSYGAISMYDDTGGSSEALGGITPNTVPIGNTIVETDTAAIERTGNDVVVKGDNKRYLILYGVAGDTGSSRTQRISQLSIGGSVVGWTKSYAYQRNASNEFCGMGGMHLHETGTTDETINLQCYRGDGVLAGEGGADVDGNFASVQEFKTLCVIELNDSAEVLSAHDSTGAQDISGGVTTALNSVRDVDFSDASSFTQSSNTEINAESDFDALVWCNVFTARQNVASGTRGTFGIRVQINGGDQTTGTHGNYSRGNQGSQDTFGYSAHAGAFFALTENDTISFETFDDGDNGAGDTTNANTLGAFSINLDSLTGPTFVDSTGSASFSYATSNTNDALSDTTGSATIDYQLTGQIEGTTDSTGSANINYDTSASISGDTETTASANISYDTQASIEADVETTGSATITYTTFAEGETEQFADSAASVQFSYSSNAEIQATADTTGSASFSYSANANGALDVSTTASALIQYSLNSVADMVADSTASVVFSYSLFGAIGGDIESQGSVVFSYTVVGVGDTIINTYEEIRKDAKSSIDHQKSSDIDAQNAKSTIKVEAKSNILTGNATSTIRKGFKSNLD